MTLSCPDAASEDAPAEDGGHEHPALPIPAAYLGLRNPYGYDDPSKAAIGANLYATQCANCHGASGKGDGPDAGKYTPRPDDLNDANAHHPDPYFFWRIHDGAALACIASDMPGFGGKLSDDEIWRVITYIRFTFLAF